MALYNSIAFDFVDIINTYSRWVPSFFVISLFRASCTYCYHRSGCYRHLSPERYFGFFLCFYWLIVAKLSHMLWSCLTAASLFLNYPVSLNLFRRISLSNSTSWTFFLKEEDTSGNKNQKSIINCKESCLDNFG